MDSKLKTLRKINKITQEDIARSVGISAKSYRKYEQGDAYPTVDIAYRLVAYFKLMYIEEIFEKR